MDLWVYSESPDLEDLGCFWICKEFEWISSPLYVFFFSLYKWMYSKDSVKQKAVFRKPASPKGSPWGKALLLSLSVLLSLICMCMHTDPTRCWVDAALPSSFPHWCFSFPVPWEDTDNLSQELFACEWWRSRGTLTYLRKAVILVYVFLYCHSCFPRPFLALLLFWCSFPGVCLSLLFYSIQAQAEHLNLLESSFLTCQTALPRYQKMSKFLLLSLPKW